MTTDSDQFVHLHVHTCYSLLDGIIRPDELVARAVKYKMPAVAITDHGNMFGVMAFYEKAVNAGIKPIIGCECYVAPRTIADKTPEDHDGRSHLVLLAETMEGYRHLCRLATIAHRDGFYHKPRIDKELLKEYAAGLIGLSACLQGEIPQLILQGKQSDADAVARQYYDIFGENNFFLEVQNNGLPAQAQVNDALLDMSQRLSIPLVGTNDCHYLDPEDSRAHEIALCIKTGQTIHDTDRLKFDTSQLNFKSAEEMCAFLEPFPQAAANTVAIADRCQVAFDFRSLHFPAVETPPDKTMADVLDDKARAGMKKRWERICQQNGHPDEAVESVYQERLDYELAVIKGMGVPAYFLIVADFTEYAKNSDIPVGPGRGSACGSLVCFCLGITDLDPIEHGLLFERFLNPERKSMPDIDVDICINGREAVLDYLAKKYSPVAGENYVAHIITFGSMKNKAAIRDVGRVLDIPLCEVDKIAKLVPVGAKTLDDALQKEPALKALIDSRQEFRELMDAGRKLEGLPRHASKHAAGVVIGDQPLARYLPLYRLNDEMVTQFDMKCVEAIGLIKLDLLGLRHLTVIDDTLKLIKKQGREAPDLSLLDMNDEPTYQLLSRGDTTGVFQLESAGMKELLVKMKPENFADITALVALYRPGPLENGMVVDYLERKQGRKATTYLVADLEPILEETCGLILYQEQIMKIVQIMAGYTPGESDEFRKAMGKKIHENIVAHRRRFVNGAAARGMNEPTALQLFEQLEYYGGYGFNKSHSAAYALIAWQMAYLKAHYPVEFMVALLTGAMTNADNMAKVIAECRDNDIEVLPPDVNQSDRLFSAIDKQIVCGLLSVKKMDEDLADSVIVERVTGLFSSLFDFCKRMAPAHPAILKDKTVLGNLIKAGAFDSTGASRAQMMAALDKALTFATASWQSKQPPALPKIDEWSPRLRLEMERSALGIYLTGDPLADHRHALNDLATTSLATIYENPEPGWIATGGIWKAIDHKPDKDRRPMARAELEEANTIIEVVIPPEIYESVRHILLPGMPVVVEGHYQFSEITIGPFQAERIIPLTETNAAELSPDKPKGLPHCLACPFCGHTETWSHMEYAPPQDYKTSTDMATVCQLHCGYCQAAGPVSIVDMTADRTQAEAAAIYQWNRRVEEKETSPRKLKPCAFCGHHPPDIEYIMDPDPPQIIETGIINQITCPECGAASPSLYDCDSCLTMWDSRNS